MEWWNEPRSWGLTEGGIWAHTEPSTDFWRETHYGYTYDSGHFFYRKADADFKATVHLAGDYRYQYDQAGLMVRLDESNWVKAGVEFVDGSLLFSVVVTRGYSDWSMLAIGSALSELTIVLTRQRDAVTVEYGTEDQPTRMVRLAYLEPKRQAMIGPMCCSPVGQGFVARFENLDIVG
jgi:regulation of enolase protein 1 (concanavalin A-like superfamily)